MKKSVATLNNEITATGGGPALAESLTGLEQRVLALMGQGFGQGLPSVRVNPFPNAEPREPNLSPIVAGVLTEDPLPAVGPTAGSSAPAAVLELVVLNTERPAPGIDREVDIVEDAGMGSGPVQETAEEPGQSPHSQPNVPPLPRRARHTRYRTRPMAPLDEARRILSQVEMQRAAADAATARALELIGRNLGRIASAIEVYIAQRSGSPGPANQ